MNLQGKEGTNAATSTLPRKCCFLVCMITRMSEMRAAPHVPSFSHFGVGFVEGYRPLGLANFPQVIPIRKTATAAAVYLAGYMTKTLKCRHPEDVGRRLIRASRNVERHTTGNFSWSSPGAWVYREKLRLFAFKHGSYSIDELHNWMGPGVAYRCRDEIYSQRIPFFPTRRAYESVHCPKLHQSGHRETGEYSVEVDCSNPHIRPIGPFPPYHLRNPQTPRYHDILRDENPF